MMLQNSFAPRMVASALAVLFLILTLVPALAAEPPVIEVTQTKKAVSEANQKPLSPMMVEIKVLWEKDRARALELESRVALASDEESILALQQEIEALAQETELEILRIQMRHARLAGHDETAAQLEQAIADIQNPPVARVSLERPAPNSQ